VVFPEPVGPVTIRIPFGLLISWRTMPTSRSVSPSISSRKSTWVRSRTRSTTLSPNIVGKTLTRRSIGLPPTTRGIRPSCGRRRSAISRLAITLIRLDKATAMLLGGGTISYRTPSIRYRILNSSSNGSKWISDALSRIACKRT